MNSLITSMIFSKNKKIQLKYNKNKLISWVLMLVNWKIFYFAIIIIKCNIWRKNQGILSKNVNIVMKILIYKNKANILANNVSLLCV